MKIDGPAISGTSMDPLRGAALDSSQQVERARGERAGSAEGVGQTDQLSLSELSARLRELNLDGVDWVQRLERLSEDVRAGRYQADVQKLAEQLIGEALRLEL